MLIYRRTSIFESPAQTLVNTVNCVGVMGKGLAHAFKAREPDMFAAYKRICDRKALVPGKLWLWRGSSSWVLNFPTKMHWKSPSKLEWIEQGLEKFVEAYEAQGITEISFPQLGCGNGNLDWEDVRPVMEHYLSKVSIPVFIHDHAVNVGVPEHLEVVAATLKAEAGVGNSFDSFMNSISRAVDLSGGTLETLGARDAFTAKMRGDRGLAIQTSSSTCLLEEEDLRGVWLDLQSGLVTKRKAGWAVKGGGEPLLSLLSILPNIRALEIQRPGAAAPEYAVEPCPQMRGYAAAGQTKMQHELAWH
jgi:O-acetyl-ADP-ribose deacetylase (regulator of RNase III)